MPKKGKKEGGERKNSLEKGCTRWGGKKSTCETLWVSKVTRLSAEKENTKIGGYAAGKITFQSKKNHREKEGRRHLGDAAKAKMGSWLLNPSPVRT